MTRNRAIKILLEQFRDIEASWDAPEKRTQLLKDLKHFLDYIQKDAADLNLPYISELARHVHENISLPHLYGLVVPVEREHSRVNITDEDFVVTTEDTDSNPSSPDVMPVSAILDNLRSAFNVGGLFRSCDCIGLKDIHICGYTATPDYPKVAKSALGTQEFLNWTQHRTAGDAVSSLHKRGYSIVALETAEDCAAPHEITFTFPCAILVGNERFGLSAELLKEADTVAKIPTYGRKNSLNVVSAFTVCAYEVRRQWDESKEMSPCLCEPA